MPLLKRLPYLQEELAYVTICVVLLWATLWSILGEGALPGSSIFSLLILVFSSYFTGQIVAFFNGPELLGMILMGFTLRNAPVISIIGSSLSPLLSSTVRGFALVILFLRAGAGIDLSAVKRVLSTFIRLAFLPCLIEGASVALAAHVILDMPTMWGLMLGSVLCAVSPAVVITNMLKIQEKKLGTEKAIPTIAISAVCFDNILAIGVFELILGIYFKTDDVLRIAIKGPGQLFLGALCGVIMASLFSVTPQKFRKSQQLKNFFFVLVVILGCLFYFGCQRFTMTTAGPMACLVLTIACRRSWMPRSSNSTYIPHFYIFNILWKFLQPALFGLIGAMLVIEQVDLTFLGKGVAVILIGLAFRMLAVVLALLGTELNLKEKFLLSIAWSTKATVQAVIGPAALEMARNVMAGAEEEEELGKKVLFLAVLSVLLTAPAGALALSIVAPKLLTLDDEPAQQDQEMHQVQVQQQVDQTESNDHEERF